MSIRKPPTPLRPNDGDTDSSDSHWPTLAEEEFQEQHRPDHTIRALPVLRALNTLGSCSFTTSMLYILLYSTLITNVAALEPAGISTIAPPSPPQFEAPNGTRRSSLGQSIFEQPAFELLTGLLFFLGGYIIGAMRRYLGPLMGITSVLWFIMRNDSAIKPIIAWTMFGAWSTFTLAYLALQCSRLVMHKLYILLALAFAGICMCIIGLVPKASIPGGLVTAIPPCTSFSAYAIAYCFPDRRQDTQHFVV